MSAHRLCLMGMVLIVIACVGAHADTYHQVTFTGNVSSTNGFAGLQWGPTITGSFVYDDNLIPSAGSGVVNIAFRNFPDIGLIPDTTAFNMTMSPSLDFNLGDAIVFSPNLQQAYIQYNNGVFVGFAYFAQFGYSGNTYELDVQGPSWSIYAAPGGVRDLTQRKASGRNFTLGQPETYVPGTTPTTVPEPATFAMVAAGLAVLAKRRKLF